VITTVCNDFNLLCFNVSFQDKSADVRKAAEGCISEILRVSGQEMIEKNLKDIQGPALALVLEKVRPGFVQGTSP
jgi:cytoskeleton-associated protein 5